MNALSSSGTAFVFLLLAKSVLITAIIFVPFIIIDFIYSLKIEVHGFFSPKKYRRYTPWWFNEYRKQAKDNLGKAHIRFSMRVYIEELEKMVIVIHEHVEAIKYFFLTLRMYHICCLQKLKWQMCVCVCVCVNYHMKNRFQLSIPNCFKARVAWSPWNA